MGLYSVIYHATSKMKLGDTTNSRTLRKWIRRVTGIAQDLEKSHDTVKSVIFSALNLSSLSSLLSYRQRKLETVVADVAERLASTETNQVEGATSQFAPRIYRKRKEILSEADKTLDAIQPPPKGHPEELQKAMSNDERELGLILEGLSQADDGLMKEVSELVANTERAEEQGLSRRMSLDSLDSQSFTTASSQIHALRNEEKAYEQFEQKLAEYKQGKRAPSIMIAVSDMCSGNGETNAHFIPFDHTFGALVESFTGFSSESFLPDFWSKASDPNYNCITKSGVCWEWQDPSKKVVDAINKEGHMGIETVCKEVEYVVVLVKKGEIENGMPIEIPRTCRQPALLHLQRHFPNHVVSQVRQLQRGEDVREVVFDNRTFCHKTNPLFVELELSIDPAQPNSAVVAAVEMALVDKGKGKAVDG